MLLEDKNAVIYGGGGSIGGAVARLRPRGGQRFPCRTLAKVEAVAEVGNVAAFAASDQAVANITYGTVVD